MNLHTQNCQNVWMYMVERPPMNPNKLETMTAGILPYLSPSQPNIKPPRMEPLKNILCARVTLYASSQTCVKITLRCTVIPICENIITHRVSQSVQYPSELGSHGHIWDVERARFEVPFLAFLHRPFRVGLLCLHRCFHGHVVYPASGIR